MGRLIGLMLALFFVLIWFGVTLSFNGLILYLIAQQARTPFWTETRGTVVSSFVAEDRDSEGNSYEPRVSYTYTVTGTTHFADRIRFGGSFHNRYSANRTARRYHVGREVSVHYNPARPAEAVLETSVPGAGELFLLLFMTPFNAITIAICRGWWRSARGVDPPAGPAATIIEEPGGVRVRLNKYSPLGAAAGVASIIAFVMSFLVVFTVGPSEAIAVAVAWAAAIGGGVIAYRKVESRIHEGRYDLVIDQAAGTLALPRRSSDSEAVTVAPQDVVAVEVVRKMQRGSDVALYQPTLRWNDGRPRCATLVELSSKEAAEALAVWLRQRLGLDAPALQAAH